nr:hypothetical protein B0A51_18447 [Rachicladosporium sp. CCFEE 5018]
MLNNPPPLAPPLLNATTRRAERARRAMDTIKSAVPEIMRSSPRVRHGVHKAQVHCDPEARDIVGSVGGDVGTHIKIRLQCQDTLSVAARLSERPFAIKRTAASTTKSQQHPNVAILNMASTVKRGGGFLDGANSQEEFLCARTTLWASLWEELYPLPETGGIWSPDMMVFRDSTPEANDLEKRDRYFIDVISAGMIRFPARGRTDEREANCSCGVSYCDRDKDIVTRKMKAVLRLAESKGVEKLVLGAWGCGAYNNPVHQVANIWRKVIAGSPRQRRPNTERYSGIKEIVFAIPDRSMLHEFEKAFAGVLCTEPQVSPAQDATDAGAERTAQDAHTSDLIAKIALVELDLEQGPNPQRRRRLRAQLADLNRDLTRGLANKAAQNEDLTLQEDEEIEDFVVSGFPGSDGEDNSCFNFDENDIASDSSDAERSEIYEFRPGALQSARASDRGDAAFDDDISCAFDIIPRASPKFDAQSGWFAGSMDELTKMLKLGHVARGSGSEPGSPSVRGEGPPPLEIDEGVVDAYLSRYGGTDGEVEEGVR